MGKRGALALTFLIFILIGYSSVFGPAKEDLADRVGTDLAGIGAVFTATFLGGLMAQSTVGPIMDRFGTRPVLLVGAGLFAFGLLMMLLSQSLVMLLFFTIIFGIGFGAVDTGSNILVAALSNNSVSTLNLLHTFFGMGAVIGPAVASLSLEQTDDAIPAIWLMLIVGVLVIPGIWMLPRTPTTMTSSKDGRPSGHFSYRSLLLWMTAALLMIYVSAEVGMSAWINTYAERTTSLSEAAAARTTSAFWFALSVGRIVAVLWGGRFKPQTLLGISLAGALIGGALVVVGEGSVAVTMAGVLVMGFFFGPPYPTTIAITTATFRSGPGKAASVVASMASLGGMIGPWIQGVLLDRVSPSASMIFLAAQIVAMLALWSMIRQRRDPVMVAAASEAV